MKTAQQKIKAWLDEQTKGAKRIELIAGFTHYITKDIEFLGENISGVNRDGVLIPLPPFQDDIPEPKDKALQEYLGKAYLGHSLNPVLGELNSRLLALESERDGGGK